MDAAELTEGLPRNEFDEPFVEVKTFALNLFGGACRLIPTGLSQTTIHQQDISLRQSTGLCNWEIISSWTLSSLQTCDAVYMYLRTDSANTMILARDLVLTILLSAGCVAAQQPGLIPAIMFLFFIKLMLWFLCRDLGEGVFGNKFSALETSCFQINKKHVEPLKELYIKNAYENKGFPYTDSATVPSQTFESTQHICCCTSTTDKMEVFSHHLTCTTSDGVPGHLLGKDWLMEKQVMVCFLDPIKWLHFCSEPMLPGWMLLLGQVVCLGPVGYSLYSKHTLGNPEYACIVLALVWMAIYSQLKNRLMKAFLIDAPMGAPTGPFAGFGQEWKFPLELHTPTQTKLLAKTIMSNKLGRPVGEQVLGKWMENPSLKAIKGAATGKKDATANTAAGLEGAANALFGGRMLTLYPDHIEYKPGLNGDYYFVLLKDIRTVQAGVTKPSELFYKAVGFGFLAPILSVVVDKYGGLQGSDMLYADATIFAICLLSAAINFGKFVMETKATVSIGVAPGKMSANPFGTASPFWVQFMPLGKDIDGIVRAIRTQQTNSKNGSPPVVLGEKFSVGGADADDAVAMVGVATTANLAAPAAATSIYGGAMPDKTHAVSTVPAYAAVPAMHAAVPIADDSDDSDDF